MIGEPGADIFNCCTVGEGRDEPDQILEDYRGVQDTEPLYQIYNIDDDNNINNNNDSNDNNDNNDKNDNNDNDDNNDNNDNDYYNSNNYNKNNNDNNNKPCSKYIFFKGNFFLNIFVSKFPIILQ